MSGSGAGTPRKRRHLSRLSGMAGATACTVLLAGCGGGDSSATASTSSPTGTEQSASSQPGRAELKQFPGGTTYWRNASGAPVVAYKTDSQLCFSYWAGLGYMPVFTGSMSEVLKQWNWSGIEGRYAYGDVPASASAVTITFTPTQDGSEAWYVDGVFGFDPAPVAEGSPDPAPESDFWVPSSREQASEDYAEFLGIGGQQFDAPTLDSCPVSADFR